MAPFPVGERQVLLALARAAQLAPTDVERAAHLAALIERLLEQPAAGEQSVADLEAADVG